MKAQIEVPMHDITPKITQVSLALILSITNPAIKGKNAFGIVAIEYKVVISLMVFPIF